MVRVKRGCVESRRNAGDTSSGRRNSGRCKPTTGAPSTTNASSVQHHPETLPCLMIVAVAVVTMLAAATGAEATPPGEVAGAGGGGGTVPTEAVLVVVAVAVWAMAVFRSHSAANADANANPSCRRSGGNPADAMVLPDTGLLPSSAPCAHSTSLWSAAAVMPTAAVGTTATTTFSSPTLTPTPTPPTTTPTTPPSPSPPACSSSQLQYEKPKKHSGSTPAAAARRRGGRHTPTVNEKEGGGAGAGGGLDDDDCAMPWPSLTAALDGSFGDAGAAGWGNLAAASAGIDWECVREASREARRQRTASGNTCSVSTEKEDGLSLTKGRYF